MGIHWTDTKICHISETIDRMTSMKTWILSGERGQSSHVIKSRGRPPGKVSKSEPLDFVCQCTELWNVPRNQIFKVTRFGTKQTRLANLSGIILKPDINLIKYNTNQLHSHTQYNAIDKTVSSNHHCLRATDFTTPPALTCSHYIKSWTSVLRSDQNLCLGATFFWGLP